MSMGSRSSHDDLTLQVLRAIVMEGPGSDPASNTTFNSSIAMFNFSEAYLYDIIQERQNNNRIFSVTVEIVLISIYTFLIVVGLVTNLLVSFVVARRQQMHTARNLYIVNLTVSDISLCLICMPSTLTGLLSRRWTLGSLLCKLVSVLQGTNIMVSVGTITVIALDRYHTICLPHTDTRSKMRVIISIGFIWICSLLATLPLFFYQRVEKVAINDVVLYETCIEDWPSIEYRVMYDTAVLFITAIIPPAVVAIVHAKIAKYLNEHARTQKDARRSKKELERNRKTTLLLSGIAIVFVVSWLPLSLFSLLTDLFRSENAQDPHNLYLGLTCVHVIAMSSAISNPIVYGWLNSNIRHEFLQLLPESCVKSKSRLDKGLIGATVADNETTRTHVHYQCVDNQVRNDASAVLVLLEASPNRQGSQSSTQL